MTGSRHRFLRRAGVMLLAAGLAAAIGGSLQVGHAGTSTKLYSLTASPASLEAGSQDAPLTLTLENSGDSQQTLGSADVYVPAGFVVTAPADGESLALQGTGNESWTVTNNDGKIELRAAGQGDALAPGDSVAAPLKVSTPCSLSGSDSGAWTSEAKQSNNFNGPPGNGFEQVGGNPVVELTPGSGVASKLVLAQQPTATQTGEAINGPPSVSVLDSCGNPAEDTDVTVSIGANPGGATIGGNTTATSSDGTATFDDVTISASGVGYTLVVSAAGLTATATSDPFDVVDVLCTNTTMCTADNSDNTTVAEVPLQHGDVLGLSFGAPGATITCDGSGAAAVGSMTTILPLSGFASSDPIEVTLTYPNAVAPGPGVANFVVCMTKDNGTNLTLPDCDRHHPTRDIPCVESRHSNAADLVLVVLISAGDPAVGTH